MSYKTILVHVDESMHAKSRIKLAAAVAMAEQAHLIGIATTGASRYMQRTGMLAELDPNYKEHLSFLRQRALRGLDIFEKVAQQLKLASVEKRLVDDEAGGGLCMQARYCDLVVIGQHDSNEPSPIVMQDFVQYVVLHCGRPVLMLPHGYQFDGIGNRVLIGWDASLAATRAVTNALSLLRRAQEVTVAVLNPETQLQAECASRSADILAYLARHQVKAQALVEHTDDNIGTALLSMANAMQCDLLVTGGYGHTRFREILLGGVTRSVLANMSLPVLMSN